jgi:flagellar biosynthetic protein FliR
MPFELLAQYLKLPVFGLVAARVGGLLMFQPLLGALSIPVHLRIILVLALAALLTPLVNLPAGAPASAVEIAGALGSEVLLGALLGLVSALSFVGLQIGGLLVAQESGIAFGQIVDPTSDEQETVVGIFYLQFAAVIYLIVGGHRALVATCLDTFETIPLLAYHDSATSATELLCQALALSGEVALRVAAPTLLVLFLVNLALGFVSRTMPQLNIIAVGFPLKGLLALALMAVSLPTAADAFLGALQQVCDWIHEYTVGWALPTQ